MLFPFFFPPKYKSTWFRQISLISEYLLSAIFVLDNVTNLQIIYEMLRNILFTTIGQLLIDTGNETLTQLLKEEVKII